MSYKPCKKHGRKYCYYSECKGQSSSSSSSADNSGQIGINTDGNLTVGLGSGLTMDMSDGSLGFQTSPGFSIDT